jgi:murein DD-endopeptidase MepM/ murein hydrolase activator NlpD
MQIMNAVVVLTQTGINAVSGKFATFNINTHQVEIRSPLNGSILYTVNKEMAWPVTGVITLEFRQTDLSNQPFHTGIDIANPNHQMGDSVTAFMEGKVIYAGEISWGYGKHKIIDNGDNITSVYAHLSKIYVYPGQNVKLGDIIASEGETGWATGPHLHFQINVFGIPVNPRIFLGEANP